MKKLVLSILLISISFGIFCQNNVPFDQLNAHMKNFHGRLRIYLKCLRGKCTLQERSAAAKAVLKDGAIILGSLAVVVSGTLLYTYNKLRQKQDLLERGMEKTLKHAFYGIANGLEEALNADPNKKEYIYVNDFVNEKQIEERPDQECQTEVLYVIPDHNISTNLKYCDKQVDVNVNLSVGLPQASQHILMNDLYKETPKYQEIANKIKQMKREHNINNIKVLMDIGGLNPAKKEIEF